MILSGDGCSRPCFCASQKRLRFPQAGMACKAVAIICNRPIAQYVPKVPNSRPSHMLVCLKVQLHMARDRHMWKRCLHRVFILTKCSFTSSWLDQPQILSRLTTTYIV